MTVPFNYFGVIPSSSNGGGTIDLVALKAAMAQVLDENGIATSENVADAQTAILAATPNVDVDAIADAVAHFDAGDAQNPTTPRGSIAYNTAMLNLPPADTPTPVIPIAAEAPPEYCRVYGTFDKQVTIQFKLLPELVAARAGNILVNRAFFLRSDDQGIFDKNIIKNTFITPADTTWDIRCDEALLHTQATLDSATFYLNGTID